MAGSRGARLLLGLISLSGLAAAASLSRGFYRNHPQELWFNYYLLPPVPVLRVISLGQDAALADLLYTSTTTIPDYFKDKAERAHIVTIANTTAFQLDPDFYDAIYFGHYFVEFEKFTGGVRSDAKDPRRLAASEISYMLLTGFHASNDSGQFAEVAAKEQLYFDAFEKVEHLALLAVAKQPDSLTASNLVALSRLRGGDDAGALVIWREIHAKTADRGSPQEKYFHATAEAKIASLEDKPVRDALEKIIEQYRLTRGKFPMTWQDLIKARMISSIPRDSRGNPFILNYNSGKVDVIPPTAKETFN